MRKERAIGPALVQIASIYMMAGVVLGLVMGISHNFALVSVHTHIGLLGWATMAITGLAYIALPRRGQSAVQVALLVSQRRPPGDAL